MFRWSQVFERKATQERKPWRLVCQSVRSLGGHGPAGGHARRRPAHRMVESVISHIFILQGRHPYCVGVSCSFQRYLPLRDFHAEAVGVGCRTNNGRSPHSTQCTRRQRLSVHTALASATGAVATLFSVCISRREKKRDFSKRRIHKFLKGTVGKP